MRQLTHVLAAVSVGITYGPATAAEEQGPRRESITHVMEIEPVWSGHPVGFCLLTAPPRQYLAYYDAQRRMTVAARKLGSADWTTQRLPSKLGWDSHNYVTMALDTDGHLHVSGNMHVDPLIYFRTHTPGDITTLERVPTMVDETVEKRVTYPRFIEGPDGKLLFRYRNGSSGRGNDHYNVYDPQSKTWSALVDGPLMDGKGKVNGYFSAPRLGPDGRFHLVGVWRDTPDAATNHSPSYARSRDLVHWEQADGTPIPLPMTPGNIDVVEPVPPRHGLINGNCRLGFDLQNRPVVSYHRYNQHGNSQIFCARFEDGTWVVRQISQWRDYRWEFGGGGSIPFEVRVGGLQRTADDRLTLGYRRDGERGRWELDPESLAIVGPAPRSDIQRASLGALTSSFPGMSVRTTGDRGMAENDRVRYVLRWETLGPHRDRPRKGPLPEPSVLRLYRLEVPAE